MLSKSGTGLIVIPESKVACLIDKKNLRIDYYYQGLLTLEFLKFIYKFAISLKLLFKNGVFWIYAFCGKNR